jgi:hypothetical protein
MTTFAVILEDKVINIIDAPSLEVAQEATGQTCIEYTENNLASIGWIYLNGEFVAPEIPTEQQLKEI